jgi:hypothetical protein
VHLREHSQAELEPVFLGLIAAEQQHRAAGGGVRRRSEVSHVHCVREDLPATARLTEKFVRGSLRELALVDDVLRRRERAPVPIVELLCPVRRPAGIGDTILVDDDRHGAALREV